MDILNWLYLVKNKFTRTTIENPATDLIVLGADVGFQKRGDKYQNYAMSVEDFAASLPAPEATYKVYTAVLTQSSTSAPTPTVLENTLGGTIVWGYSSVGTYSGTLAGAFTSQKTFFYASNEAAYNGGPQLYTQKIRTFARITDGIISLTQTELNFTAGVFSSAGNTNTINNLYIEIRVYN